MNRTKILKQLANQAKISTTLSSSTTAAATTGGCPFHLHKEPSFPNNSNAEISKSSSQVESSASIPQSQSASPNITKPYSEVPEPKGLPFVGTVLDFIISGGGKYLHTYVEKRRASLGPIYKEKYSLEPIKVLFIGDVDGFRDVYRNESNQPDSLVQYPPALYMKKRGVKRGLFFTSGDEWARLRKPMNNLILKRKDYHDRIYSYFEDNLNHHFDHWNSISQSNLDNSVPNFERLISYLGLSCFGRLAFGSKWEKHSEIIDKDSQRFHDLITVNNSTNRNMMLFPPQIAMKLNLPLWTNFERTTFELLNIGYNWTKLAIEDLKTIKTNEEKGLLHMMLSEYNYSENDVERIFSDTVATMETETTMYNWMTYILGQHPEAQEKIWNEIRDSIGTRKLKYGDIEGLTFLKSCVKETLRLFPSSAFTVRIFPKESVIKGYQVPAGTVAAMSLWSAQRDPTNFPDPERFWPERWIRVQNKTNFDPSDEEILSSEEVNNQRCPLGVQGAQPYMPYAWGTRRGCVFRRISQINMSLIFGRLVQEFQWKTQKVEPIMRSLLVPDRDIGLKLKKR